MLRRSQSTCVYVCRREAVCARSERVFSNGHRFPNDCQIKTLGFVETHSRASPWPAGPWRSRRMCAATTRGSGR